MKVGLPPSPLSSTGRNVVLLLFLERERGWEEEKEAFQFLHRPKKKCVGRFFLAFLCVVVVFALSLLFASFLSPLPLFFCRSLLVAILFPSLSLSSWLVFAFVCARACARDFFFFRWFLMVRTVAGVYRFPVPLSFFLFFSFFGGRGGEIEETREKIWDVSRAFFFFFVPVFFRFSFCLFVTLFVGSLIYGFCLLFYIVCRSRVWRGGVGGAKMGAREKNLVVPSRCSGGWKTKVTECAKEKEKGLKFAWFPFFFRLFLGALWPSPSFVK